VYPADDRCRIQEAHSKWHEENGNGLLDLMFLSDDIFSVTTKASGKARIPQGRVAGVRGALHATARAAASAAASAAGEASGRVGAFAAGMVSGYQSYVATILGRK